MGMAYAVRFEWSGSRSTWFARPVRVSRCDAGRASRTSTSSPRRCFGRARIPFVRAIRAHRCSCLTLEVQFFSFSQHKEDT